MGKLGIGLKRGTPVSGDRDNSLRQEILREVYAKGKGACDEKVTKDNCYMISLAMYSVAFGAVRNAIVAGGPLTPERIRAGYESIGNLKNHELSAPVTPQDHGSASKTRIESWDGKPVGTETD